MRMGYNKKSAKSVPNNSLMIFIHKYKDPIRSMIPQGVSVWRQHSTGIPGSPSNHSSLRSKAPHCCFNLREREIEERTFGGLDFGERVKRDKSIYIGSD
jgi:hypothetical protein